MTTSTKAQLEAMVVEAVVRHPGGITLSALVDELAAACPVVSRAELAAVVSNVEDGRLRWPSPGVVAPVEGAPEVCLQGMSEAHLGVEPAHLHEQDFYAPFAAWLRDELGEVTVAEALGGSSLGHKWGTPDVVAAYKPRARDRVKFPLELVTAEVKIVPSEAMVAFGQAASYRLFSTRTYMVMPRRMTVEERSRLEALCTLFGTGLVVFTVDRTAPDFALVTRAQRFNPDMFYVNEFADRLSQNHPELFDRIFG